MRVLVAGSTGLLGEALIASLHGDGHEVVRLVRPETDADGIPWDPARGMLDGEAVEGFDAAVNLAGRSIGERRWTDAEKELVWSSRVDPTRLLAEALAGVARPPSVLLNASAVGYYGDRGDTEVSERDGPGAGFMADLCVAWEEATRPAADVGVRVVALRSGVVFSSSGGVLGRILAPFGPKWLSPFRWGLGGVVGRGRQWMPWISLHDQVAAMRHLLDADLAGPVNLVAPVQATHRMFIKALGRALHRPTVLPIPPFVIKLLFGSELARSLVLEGQRVLPTRLEESGFTWADTDLEAALEDALGKR